MGSQVNYLVSKNSVTVNYTKNLDGEESFHTKTILAEDELYDLIITAIKEDRLEDIPDLLEIKDKKIFDFSDGNMRVVDGLLYIDGEVAQSDLADRILKHADEGLPYQPLVNFWRRLKNNPSYRAVQGLFRFLDANHHPITEDGCFLAYKGVRGNYTDCHTGTMDNSIGQIVSMPRNKVNEDPNQTCSHGLHVASHKLAHTGYGAGGRGGAITLVVKVDPEHVVAVPYEYGDEKMRVCQYKVIGLSDRGEIPFYQASEEDPYVEPDDEELSDWALLDKELDDDDVAFLDKNIYCEPSFDEDDDDFDDDDFEDEDFNDW